MGLFFENLCIRDLRVYAQALDGEVYHQENIIRRSIPKKENNVSIWEKIKRKIKSLW